MALKVIGRTNYFIFNECNVNDCIYNYKGRCFCRQEEMKRDNCYNCTQYIRKTDRRCNALQHLLRKGEELVLPAVLLMGRHESFGKANQFYKVKILRMWQDRTLVSYNVNGTELKTEIFNVDIINTLLRDRQKEREAEMRKYEIT